MAANVTPTLEKDITFEELTAGVVAALDKQDYDRLKIIVQYLMHGKYTADLSNTGYLSRLLILIYQADDVKAYEIVEGYVTFGLYGREYIEVDSALINGSRNIFLYLWERADSNTRRASARGFNLTSAPTWALDYLLQYTNLDTIEETLATSVPNADNKETLLIVLNYALNNNLVADDFAKEVYDRIKQV
jgi:hypothetical protein